MDKITITEIGPSKVIQLFFPVSNFHAIVVVDNVALGPSIGGVRVSPDVTVDEVKRLARTMTMKNSVAGLPHGGGKAVSEVKAKSAMDCVTCHNPHKRAKFSIKKDCAACHSKQGEAFTGSQMQKVGVTCVDCHMPRATKSATAKSKTEGDIRTHVFKINTDPKTSMFYKEPKLDKDGKQVMKDGKPVMAEFSKGFVTLDFACLNCHKNKDMKWASEMAKGIHKK